jgi:Family of unknown function (DUF6084)
MKLLLPADRLAMVDLDFALDGITVEPFATVPTLRFALRISNATPALAIKNVMLNCQIRIEPAQRDRARPACRPVRGAGALGADPAQLFVDPCKSRGCRV